MFSLFQAKNKTGKKEQEDLKKSLDVSSASNRNLLIFFLAFLIYMTLVLFDTSDLMLLLPIFGIKLPILRIEVPVLGFYFIAPILALLLHFNLLLNLHQHHEKLKEWMPHFDRQKALQLYPFIYNMKDGEKQGVLRLLIRVVYYILPSLLFFGIFFRAYSYQSPALSLWHLFWVLAEMCLYFIFPVTNLFNSTKDAQRQAVKWIRWTGFTFILLFLLVRLEGEPFNLLRKVVLLKAPVHILNTPNLNFPSLFQAHKAKLLANGSEKFSLEGRSLRGANLANAVFCTTAKVKGKDGKEVDQHHCLVLFDEHTDFSFANLSGAKLQGANLEGANLQNATLWEANLEGADLWEANLQGANLRSANLQGVTLGDANLQGATLAEANLQGANLRSTNLQGVTLGDANLQGADLYFANLQGANLLSANLQNANLNFANLQGADLSGIWIANAHFWAKDLERNSEEWRIRVEARVGRKLEPKLEPKEFLCRDYLPVTQAIYHQWLAESPEKAVEFKAELKAELKACPPATWEFLESKPEEWDYNKAEDREKRKKLFAEIRK